MAYTTEAKVKSQLKDIKIDDDTTPSTSDISTFISEEEAEINARLSEMYITPVTGTESVKILSKVATLKVAARVTRILEVEDAGEGKNRPAATAWATEAERLLSNVLPTYRDLSGGKVTRARPVMPLPDATINKGVPGISASVTKGQTAVDSTKATFTKGADNW